MKRSGGLVAAFLGGLLIVGWALPSGTAFAAVRAAQLPPAPAPGYTPDFVTQTDERPPWDDCLWASGAMLLDKWTHGAIQPNRVRLRRASRELSGGSSLSDLARAIDRTYGWRPLYSPNGGERLTWTQLLDRLASGGGAVIAGRYGRLGAPFTRWDRSYAADPKAAGHALFVERYDSANGRMWLMDPLGRGGYAGEWVPVARVKSFIWQRGGFVVAMATPAPPPPGAGYVPGLPSLAAGSHRTGDVVPLSVPLLSQGDWPLPAVTLATRWQLVNSDVAIRTTIMLDGSTVAVAPPETTGASPLTLTSDHPAQAPIQLSPATAADNPAAAVTTAALEGNVALPSQPGLWRLTATVKRSDGGPLPGAWQLAPVDVHVWGDRGATVTPLAVVDGLNVGRLLQVTVGVENAGRLAWSYADAGTELGRTVLRPQTQLYANWVDSSGAPTPAMAPMPLFSGAGVVQTIPLVVQTPRTAGDYMLSFDVRDAAGSLLAPEDASGQLHVFVDAKPAPPAEPALDGRAAGLPVAASSGLADAPDTHMNLAAR